MNNLYYQKIYFFIEKNIIILNNYYKNILNKYIIPYINKYKEYYNIIKKNYKEKKKYIFKNIIYKFIDKKNFKFYKKIIILRIYWHLTKILIHDFIVYINILYKIYIYKTRNIKFKKFNKDQ